MKQPGNLRPTACSILGDSSITALFVLLLFLGSFFLFTKSALAKATTMTPQNPLSGLCSKPIEGHCYAIIDWYGNTGGTNTLINPYGALNCQGCSGFINDEMWFSDTKSSQCLAVGTCWVEAGVSTWPANQEHNCNQGHDSTCLFWADNRPGGGGYHQWGNMYYFGADGVERSYAISYLYYYRQ
jgi:hypothetical protein